MRWLVPLRDSQEKINVLKEQARDEQCWLVPLRTEARSINALKEQANKHSIYL